MYTVPVTFFITFSTPHSLSYNLVTDFTVRNVKYKSCLKQRKLRQQITKIMIAKN